jgi:hypothetical protein
MELVNVLLYFCGMDSYFSQKYKGFSKCFSSFLFLNNFVAKFGLTGVIAEVRTFI